MFVTDRVELLMRKQVSMTAGDFALQKHWGKLTILEIDTWNYVYRKHIRIDFLGMYLF